MYRCWLLLLLCVQRNIRSLKQLVSMNDDDRRLLLRQLTDSEYRDVLSVCAMMPNVDITAHCEGLAVCLNSDCSLGRLFDRVDLDIVDLIKPVSNVRPSVCTYVLVYIIYRQKVAPISVKLGRYIEIDV